MIQATARSAHPPNAIDDEEFIRRGEPFRGELLAYCYRMLGSLQDAEDLVQDIYLRAWRGYGGFEERSSMRTWLYRIATRACLRALEGSRRRPLPSGLGGPSDDLDGPRPALRDLPWLQPAPDTLFGADPAAVVEARQTTRLAFIAALQLLPGRQRAALILHDVLAWRTAEIADQLNTTVAAVNSALQRARAQLRTVEPTEDAVTEPTDPQRRMLLDRYVAAFNNADLAALTEVLTEDATWEMPPIPTWFAGRATVVRFLRTRVRAAGVQRLVPANLNGQPAFAAYTRGDDGVYRAHALHVLSLGAAGITGVVAFLDPDLFAPCRLPPVFEIEKGRPMA